MTTFLIIYRFSLPLVCLTALASMFFFSYFIFIGTHRFFLFFFFNDPAPPEIYTLPLHDALPIYRCVAARLRADAGTGVGRAAAARSGLPDGGLNQSAQSEDHHVLPDLPAAVRLGERSARRCQADVPGPLFHRARGADLLRADPCGRSIYHRDPPRAARHARDRLPVRRADGRVRRQASV